jgi:hypothetical protein
LQILCFFIWQCCYCLAWKNFVSHKLLAWHPPCFHNL